MEQISINTRGCITSCPLCSNRKFVSRQALEEHWTNARSHGWCQGCERLFQSRSEHAQHMSDSHNHPVSASQASPGDASSQSHSHEDDHTPPKPRPTPSDASPLREPHHDVACFGCGRLFVSYSSMMLHLEEGACKITARELGRFAAGAADSHLYVLPQWRRYIDEVYGREQIGFDTDIEREGCYECVECRSWFQSLNQANQHAKSPVHKPLVFKCPGCQTRHSALSGMLQHVEQSARCEEGLHRGTGAMGRLLQLLEERVRGRRVEHRWE